MSLGAITGSGNSPDIRGAAAPSRAGSVAASLAAQARFDALDAVQISTRQAAPQAKPSNDQRQFTPPRDGNAQAGSDRTGARPAQSSSAFLTQALAQEQDNGIGSATSPFQRGAAAYNRAASRSAPSPQDSTSDVLLPLQPSLNSGRALDLAV